MCEIVKGCFFIRYHFKSWWQINPFFLLKDLGHFWLGCIRMLCHTKISAHLSILKDRKSISNHFLVQILVYHSFTYFSWEDDCDVYSTDKHFCKKTLFVWKCPGLIPCTLGTFSQWKVPHILSDMSYIDRPRVLNSVPCTFIGWKKLHTWATSINIKATKSGSLQYILKKSIF